MLAVGLVRSGADINKVQHHRPRDWDVFIQPAVCMRQPLSCWEQGGQVG